MFERPDDVPDAYVVRRFEGEIPTAEAYSDPDIEALREIVRRRSPGAIRIGRSPSDVPSVVETWI